MVVMESVSVVALRLPNIEWRAAVMYQVSLTLMIPTSPGGRWVFAREVFLQPNSAAWAFFERQPPDYRRQVSWLQRL
jgi:hypothetical protein